MALLAVPRYVDYRDVTSRLNHTLVRYNGMFGWVTCLEELAPSMHIALRLENGDGIQVHSSDKDLDLKALPLGYANYKGSALYITRLPNRKMKQCICQENTVSWSGSRGVIDTFPVSKDLFHSRSFLNMLKGEYPSVDVALHMLDGKNQMESAAFSRRFCLAFDAIGLVRLYYFMTPIAVYSRSKKKFILVERFGHYKHILEHYNLEVEIGE